MSECAYCGAALSRSRKAKYCSPSCRSKAWHLAHDPVPTHQQIALLCYKRLRRAFLDPKTHTRYLPGINREMITAYKEAHRTK